MSAVDAEYAALAADYDRTWAAYNIDTAIAARVELWDRWDTPRLTGCVLDVGCGTGVLLEELADYGTPTVGLDRSGPMLENAREKLPGTPLVRGDAASLPFGDDSFLGTVSNSALHYLPDPAVAVREMVRVTKPGGPVIWVDWDGGALATRLVVVWLRLTRRPLGRVLSADAMAAALREAGLQQVRVHRWRHGRWWGLATVSGIKPT